MIRLVIATRGSQLALWQAHHVKAQIEATTPGTSVELLEIKTSGDKILDVPLAKVGGKGLFVKEIEQALVEKRADLAVHSMKDVAAELHTKLIGFTDDVDIKRAADQLGMTNDQARELQELQPGTFYAKGPSLSRVRVLVHARDPKTSPPPKGEIRTSAPPAPEKVRSIGFGILASARVKSSSLASLSSHRPKTEAANAYVIVSPCESASSFRWEWTDRATSSASDQLPKALTYFSMATYALSSDSCGRGPIRGFRHVRPRSARSAAQVPSRWVARSRSRMSPPRRSG